MNANLIKFRGLLLVAFHAMVITLSLSIAVWIRFEFSLRSLESSLLITGLTLILPIKMVVFWSEAFSGAGGDTPACPIWCEFF